MIITVWVLTEEQQLAYESATTEVQGIFSSLHLAQAGAQNRESTPLVWEADWCGAVRSKTVSGGGVDSTYEISAMVVDQVPG